MALDGPLAQAIFAEINKDRQAHGRSRYVTVAQLRNAAVEHVQDMAAHGLFAHESSNGETCPNRIRRFFPSAGWSFWSVGECLFWISASSATAHVVVQAWLNSPPHRAIVLSPT